MTGRKKTAGTFEKIPGRVLTQVLDGTFDAETFGSAYDVFRVVPEDVDREHQADWYARVMDLVSTDEKILSTAYGSEKRIGGQWVGFSLVLMRHDPEGAAKNRAYLLTKILPGRRAVVSLVAAHTIRDIMDGEDTGRKASLQNLFIGTAVRSQSLPFSNVLGKVLLYDHTTEGEDGNPKVFTALELSVRHLMLGNYLAQEAVTFRRIDTLEPKERKEYRKSWFILREGGFIDRWNGNGKKAGEGPVPLYARLGIPHQKASILFLGTAERTLEQSKMRKRCDVLQAVNDQFPGILHLENHAENASFLSEGPTAAKAREELAAKIMARLPQLVLDVRISEEDGFTPCFENVFALLCDTLRENYGYCDENLIFQKGYAKKQHALPCLVVIHNRETSEKIREQTGKEDEHADTWLPAQHLTYEDTLRIFQGYLPEKALRALEESDPETAGKQAKKNAYFRNQLAMRLRQCLLHLALTCDITEGRAAIPDLPRYFSKSHCEGAIFLRRVFADDPQDKVHPDRKRQILTGYRAVSIGGDHTLRLWSMSTEGENGINARLGDRVFDLDDFVSADKSAYAYAVLMPDHGAYLVSATRVSTVVDADEIEEFWEEAPRIQRADGKERIASGHGLQAGANIESGKSPLRSVTDLGFWTKTIRDEELLFYFSRSRSKGLNLSNGKIATAPNIYAVRAVHAKLKDFEKVLYLCLDPITRGGEISVSPMPLSYLSAAGDKRMPGSDI